MAARDPRLIYLLAVAHKRIQGFVRSAAEGATPARSGLLMALPEDPTGVPLGEVGRSLDLGASSLSGLVDRMARSGLVERLADPQDGRAFRLRLTAAGIAARRAAVAHAGPLNQRLREGFTDEEIATVARWLVAVADRFPGDDR